jgi:hypothetical protein
MKYIWIEIWNPKTSEHIDYESDVSCYKIKYIEKYDVYLIFQQLNFNCLLVFYISFSIFFLTFLILLWFTLLSVIYYNRIIQYKIISI